jgi:hypothetical protein
VSGAANATLIRFLLRLGAEFQSGNLGLNALRADKALRSVNSVGPRNLDLRSMIRIPAVHIADQERDVVLSKSIVGVKRIVSAASFAIVHNLITAAA